MRGDRHAVVLAAGRILQPGEYAGYKPSPGEDVIIRTVPTAPVVAVIAALGTAFAGAAGIAAGTGLFLGLSAATWSLIGIGISVEIGRASCRERAPRTDGRRAVPANRRTT